MNLIWVLMRGVGIPGELFAILGCTFCRASDVFNVIRGGSGGRSPLRKFCNFRVYFMQIF